ncbi:hypothetical protein ILYODFUR_039239 [Ilyodon furcidens]|uniref:Uncharacterized protein n=1 Tax=Ilyodon furcidens TaxID=33524 RepID=A0ABV0UDD9_9TELE
MRAPSGIQYGLMNRKHLHSINVQPVSDAPFGSDPDIVELNSFGPANILFPVRFESLIHPRSCWFAVTDYKRPSWSVDTVSISVFPLRGTSSDCHRCHGYLDRWWVLSGYL